MSFAYNVKSELCAAGCENTCCKKAELYGFLLFGRRFTQTGIAAQTEHWDVVNLITGMLKELYSVEPVQKTAKRGDGRDIDCLSIEREPELSRLLQAFGHDVKNITLRINRANIENECCNAAFLRGVFLACGSIVDPGKDYHLEFVSPHIRLGRDLTDFLSELTFVPKTIVRKGNFVVYFKDSEQIEDLLTLMGAVKRSLELMNIKVYKDLRNNVNRVTNCETANIGKTVDASVEQLKAINKLISSRGYACLPDELRDIAKLRIENPDSSLRELAELTGISRSGVNHRLHRIMDIAEKKK